MVVKEFTFDSAHFLPLHKGKCHNLHGHTYKLQIGISVSRLDKNGMVIDFADLKESTNYVLENLDHKCLNEISAVGLMHGFPADCPTAEMMVIWLAEVALPKVLNPNMQIEKVRLYETPTSYAEWGM